MFNLWSLGRKEQLIIVLILAAVLFGGGYQYSQFKTAHRDGPILLVDETEDQDQEAVADLTVHVTGAVEKPGVYQLTTGSRCVDAVDLAVPNAEADVDQLNLAAPLADGQKILVPALGDNDTTLAQNFENAGGGGDQATVNINTASIQELGNLPGIGPALSQRIIDYRQANGGFKAIEEIKQVAGIGDKKYESIKELISIY